MTTNIDSELAQAQQEATALNIKIAQLKMKKLETSKANFKAALEGVLKLYKDTVATPIGAAVWKEKEFAKILRELALVPIFVRDSKLAAESESDIPSEGDGIPKERKPRSELTTDEVFDFIKATGKPTVGQVNDHFKGKASKVTVGNRINELVNLKQISKDPAEKGNSKILQVV